MQLKKSSNLTFFVPPNNVQWLHFSLSLLLLYKAATFPSRSSESQSCIIRDLRILHLGAIQQLSHAKIVFFDPPTLHHHALSCSFIRTLLRYVTLSKQPPNPRA